MNNTNAILEDVDDLILEANEKTNLKFQTGIDHAILTAIGALGAGVAITLLSVSSPLIILFIIILYFDAFMLGINLGQIKYIPVMRKISKDYTDEVNEIGELLNQNKLFKTKDFRRIFIPMVKETLRDNKCIQYNKRNETKEDCFDSFSRDFLKKLKDNNELDPDFKKELIIKIEGIIKKVKYDKENAELIKKELNKENPEK